MSAIEPHAEEPTMVELDTPTPDLTIVSRAPVFAPFGMGVLCLNCYTLSQHPPVTCCNYPRPIAEPWRPPLTEADRVLLAAVEDGHVLDLMDYRAGRWITRDRLHPTKGYRGHLGGNVTARMARYAAQGLAERLEGRVPWERPWRLTAVGRFAMRPLFPAPTGEHGPCPRCGGDYGPYYDHDDRVGDPQHYIGDACITCGWTSDRGTPEPITDAAEEKPTT